MRKFSMLLSTIVASGMIVTAGEPTDVRTWESTDGRTIVGRATALEGDTVTIILTSNKTVRFSISKLEIKHQMFVKDHFGTEIKEAKESVNKAKRVPAKGKKGKKGKKAKKGKGGNGLAAVKQDSVEGSFYFHYVPSTAPAGDRPSIFWTGARAGNAKDINRFAASAELTGMTIIACGNSQNAGSGNVANSVHMKRNIEHSEELLELSGKRRFFAGVSGGGQRSLQNADKYQCAGGMPTVAYLGSTKPSKGHYYVISGAFDFNRYASAHIAKTMGNSAIHVHTPGGHSGLDAYSINDGAIWLYTSNAYIKRTASSEELIGFEDRFYTYLTTDLSEQPWRAYYWTDHLLNTCRLNGVNRSKFTDLHKSLEADPKNVLYLEGMEALNSLSQKHMAGVSSSSKMKHSSKAVNTAAAKFVKKYGEIPRLRQIGVDLQKKTDKL